VPERYLKKKKQLLALPFDKVLPCHGTFVATAGARMIKQALM
jgi:glyoxylase-like metal-dependent hydrolase (beta-lactamase superfamily II)